MIFAGLGSPIGRAVGMGFEAPVTEADFDQLENFYYSRKAPAQLDYCPLTDISLLEIARKRGYGIAELNNVLVRNLDTTEIFPPGPRGLHYPPRQIRRSLGVQRHRPPKLLPRWGRAGGLRRDAGSHVRLPRSAHLRR